MGDVTQFNAPPEEKRALVEVGARGRREDMQRKMRGTRIKANIDRTYIVSQHARG